MDSSSSSTAAALGGTYLAVIDNQDPWPKCCGSGMPYSGRNRVSALRKYTVPAWQKRPSGPAFPWRYSPPEPPGWFQCGRIFNWLAPLRRIYWWVFKI